MSAQNWNPPTLSVIVPTFNERENIAPLIEKLEAALAGTTFEVIVVDDNSPDGTADLAKQIATHKTSRQMHPSHRAARPVIGLHRRDGVLRGRFVAVIDADHQHDETILPKMLEQARAGADIVGVHAIPGQEVRKKAFRQPPEGVRAGNPAFGALTGKALSDPMSGFFLLRRSLFNQIVPRLSREGFKILLDIIATGNRQLGRKLVITEVPYTFAPALPAKADERSGRRPVPRAHRVADFPWHPAHQLSLVFPRRGVGRRRTFRC